MSKTDRPTPWALTPFGAIGRAAMRVAQPVVRYLQHTTGVWSLFRETVYHSTVVPLRRRGRIPQLFVMLSNVGVQSFPIVFLVSLLMGAILVLQSGEPLQRFGQLPLLPGAVAWSLTREISPLLTSILITARVGSSFTAVLASMKINDEIMALETMVIHPVGYLVAPRFLSMIVMLPCLTIFSYLIGMLGAAVVAHAVYDLSYTIYFEKTIFYLDMKDIVSGLCKAGVFAMLISTICCYYGLITEGGPVGVGRNIMVAVVTSVVAIIVADALVTAIINNYVL